METCHAQQNINLSLSFEEIRARIFQEKKAHHFLFPHIETPLKKYKMEIENPDMTRDWDEA